MNILSHFPNITSLKLAYISFNSVATASNPFTDKVKDIKRYCSNVRALEMSQKVKNQHFRQAFIDAIGD